MQGGVNRVVRNNAKRTILSLSSLLESRNCVLHLRTILDWQRIQKKVSQTMTGCSLYPALRDQERALRCSTWQNLRTERVLYSLECVDEMLQERGLSRWTLYGYSRSIASEIQFIVNHISQLDGQNKSAKSWTNLHKKTVRIVSFQRKREDTKDNGIKSWTNEVKMGLWNFDPIFELPSVWKIVYTM